MRDLKGEFLKLETVSLEDFSYAESEDTAIKVDEGRNKTFKLTF